MYCAVVYRGQPLSRQALSVCMAVTSPSKRAVGKGDPLIGCYTGAVHLVFLPTFLLDCGLSPIQLLAEGEEGTNK